MQTAQARDHCTANEKEPVRCHSGGLAVTILRKGTQYLVATTFLYFAAVAQAVPPGPALAPRAPQVMLYISRPMGGGAGPMVKPSNSGRDDQK